MADNIVVDTLATDPSVATDDVGGHHYQYVKLAYGGDGVATLVDTSNRLPVAVSSLTPGTGVTDLGKAVDAVATDTDVGVAVLAKRVTTPASITPANGDYSVLQLDDSGNLRVNVTAGGSQAQIDDSAFTAGATEIVAMGGLADETATDSVDEGDMGAFRMTLDRKAITTEYAHSGGGWDVARLLSAASTNATSLKASAGRVHAIYAFNANASVRYLKFYNKASAPTVGTDTPVLTLPIPGNSNGFVIAGCDWGFATGIAYALTTGIGDADTGAVAANEVVLAISYK